MPDEKFALPSISYKELGRLVVAYSRLKSAASLEEISKVSGINTDTITRNNPFLAASGIITKTAKKAPTEIGRELGRAIDFGAPDAISTGWKKVVDSHDVFHQFVDFVKNRREVDGESLQTQICLIAGVAKNERTLRGATTVVNILLTAGVISEKEKNRFIPGSPQGPATQHVELPDETVDNRVPEQPAKQNEARVRDAGTDSPSLHVNVQVHIAADATADQIEQIFASMAKHLYRRT